MMDLEEFTEYYTDFVNQLDLNFDSWDLLGPYTRENISYALQELIKLRSTLTKVNVNILNADKILLAHTGKIINRMGFYPVDLGLPVV